MSGTDSCASGRVNDERCVFCVYVLARREFIPSAGMLVLRVFGHTHTIYSSAITVPKCICV